MGVVGSPDSRKRLAVGINHRTGRRPIDCNANWVKTFLQHARGTRHRCSVGAIEVTCDLEKVGTDSPKDYGAGRDVPPGLRLAQNQSRRRPGALDFWNGACVPVIVGRTAKRFDVGAHNNVAGSRHAHGDGHSLHFGCEDGC